MGSFNSASRFPRGKKPFLPGKSPSSVFSFIELHLMAISSFSTGREMHDLQVKVKLPPSPSRLSNGAEFGLFPVTVVSLELYRLPHQDFSDWIDFSSGHRESQRKRKRMLSLNHVTGQDTMPPPPRLQPSPPPPYSSKQHLARAGTIQLFKMPRQIRKLQAWDWRPQEASLVAPYCITSQHWHNVEGQKMHAKVANKDTMPHGSLCGSRA